MSRRCDIAIVGGGMVGVSLALLLAERLSTDTDIVLLESFSLPLRDKTFANTYTPSFDARSTALSYSSYRIYSELGVWPELAARACPIRRIHVSQRGHFGSALLCAEDCEWSALGFVLENAWLGSVLIQQLHKQGRVQLRSPARVESARGGTNGYQLNLADGTQVRAKLLIVAAGADSALRQALGIAVEKTDYGQQAVIANIGHRSDHNGCAYERFTDQGPLAMLPLPGDTGDGYRSALVWTMSAADAAHKCTCPDGEFLPALQERFGYRLGRLNKVGERFSYPLALVRAKEQVRAGVVLLGNAAHALHPVAGQGFNLALRDAVVLAGILAAAQRGEEALDALSVLQRYVDAQQRDQARTVAFSHHLPGLFSHGDPALRALRDLGLFTLDLSAGLKREFVRQTAGMAALGGAAGPDG